MAAPSRIRVLSESLANQIAAGEVVQRPASALKELVENSLDAGACSVAVDLEVGGSRRIRVRDDGEGMGRDDALLAFERHATSKIGSEADLHQVATLGFRGEALPSIAAISKVCLLTRRRKEELGTEVRIEGGRVQRVTEMGAPEGTEVDIHSLFFNVPARRKFLKRKETELARCVEVVSRAAMAYPETAFVLRHGGRTILDVRTAGGRLERAAELLGGEAMAHLLEIPERDREDVRFSGWVGAPSLNRSGRDGQYLFVNARPVRDRLLVHAVYEAYRSFLPARRHPVFALFLDMSPAEVDVNVHPSKEEVRFRNASLVYEVVRDAVASRLGAAPMARPRLVVRHSESVGAPDRMEGNGALRPRGSAARSPGLLGGGGYIPPDRESRVPSSIREQDARAKLDEVFGGSEEERERAYSSEAGAPSFVAESPSGLERVLQPPHPADPVRLSECRYLGQWEECFLLFSAPQGLVLVDQHAAHERVLYNRFRDQFREGRVETQVCLVPQKVILRPEEAIRLESHRATLERSGFDLEPAGPGAYFIREVPALLAERDPAGAVRRVVEGLAELDEPMSFPNMIDGIIARMSCRGAIKAAQSLHPEEVAALVEEIEKTPGRWTCPHGRPLMLVLGVGAVYRRFLRS